MILFLWIAIAGGLGCVCRYLLSALINHFWRPLEKMNRWSFPLATLFTNCFACFLIGVIAHQFLQLPQSTTEDAAIFQILTLGFCGGFSTLSTAIVEAAGLLRGAREYRRSGILYLALTVSLPVFATLAGLAV